MAIFQDMHQSDARSVYKKMKSYLAAYDGKMHVVMINSFSKIANEIFGCDTKYTSDIDLILRLMQNDGYEILDVKMNSIQDQGILGQREGFHTLITYRSPEKHIESLQNNDKPVDEGIYDPDAPKIVKVEGSHKKETTVAKKDWVCKVCGAINDKDRRSCKECGSPK